MPLSPLLPLEIAAAAEAGEAAARFSSGTLGEASRERFAAGGAGFDGEAGRDGGQEGGRETDWPPAEALAGCWFGLSLPFSLAASLTLRIAALSRSCRSRPTSGAPGCTGERTMSSWQMHLNGTAVGRSQTCLCQSDQHSCCMRESLYLSQNQAPPCLVCTCYCSFKEGPKAPTWLRCFSRSRRNISMSQISRSKTCNSRLAILRRTRPPCYVTT